LPSRRGVNPDTFRLTDAAGAVVPASVDQVGDGTGAVSNQVLEPGAVSGPDFLRCAAVRRVFATPITWRFTVSETRGRQRQYVRPIGFPARTPPIGAPPSVTAVAFSGRAKRRS
jgi:hypothetical protein